MKTPVQFRLSETSNLVKLTNWTNEPTILNLKNDFETAKPSQQAHMVKVDRWNDLMAVKGQARPKKVKGRSSVQPKLIRRQAEWRYSALTEPFLSSKKLFTVNPVTYEDGDAARQNELVINWQFRTKLNRVKFVDDFVRAVVDEGTGIVQIGWQRDSIMVDQEVPVYAYYPISKETDADKLQEAIALKDENTQTYEEEVPAEIKAAVDFFNETGSATVAVKTRTESVKVERVLRNQPSVQIINPKNFYLDPSSNGDMEKALFAIVSFETNKAELQKQGARYKNLDKVNWSAATVQAATEHASNMPDTMNLQDDLRKRVVAYEYWGFYDINKTGELVPIVATWIGDTLIRMEENPFPDQKLPFVLVPYLPVKRELYGEPDAELLEDNQKIVGAVMRGMIDTLGRSANAQQGFAKGMLDPLNRRRFENGQDYEFNPNLNPTQGLIEHRYPELSQSALIMANIQNQDAEALTGVKAFSGGLSGDAYGDVAAGIRGALDAASKREMAILRRIAKGMVDIANKIVSMNAVFLSKKETIRVTNREFVEIKREDLQGNFDLDTDISTAEVDNQKAQDLAFMLQTMGPNMDIGITLMILAEIAELKRMPELAEKIRTFTPQPTPEQQQMQQLQLEEMKLKVEELRSKIALNEAQAEKAKSDAMATRVDTVMTADGSKHEQELEKQGGQARGNMDLEVTKAALKTQKRADGSETSPNIEAGIGWNEMSDRLRKVNSLD